MPRAFRRVLTVLLLIGAVPAFAASQPTLFSITSGKAEVLAQGAQKSWPIKVSEGSAFDAIFQGGMWLPNPTGGQIYAKYQRHIIHANGIWTWVGKVSTVHGEQSVVLTFGKDGVFGEIPQTQGYPLRIFTNANGSRVLATSAQAMARSAEQLRLRSQPDYFIPPRKSFPNAAKTSSPRAATNAATQTSSSGAVTIDVMVAYSSGFVTEMGSQSLALTRIQNLVDLTNQAYTDSAVNQQIRLVDTVEVNYPDNTSNQSALDDISGFDQNGNPVTIPASLQGIASLRTEYGADLVTLLRSFDDTTQGNCGVGWLIGGNETAIVPSQDYVYGYNVVSDGTSINGSGQSVYCLDTTFAHELGHNMGNAHDRANASTPGAYSYSYGYDGSGTSGFSTIMAYGTATDTPLSVFSNPNISTCQNTPCGVADSASDSADNAHSMNNTASLIAAFEPTKVGVPSGSHAVDDFNGDGNSDIFWYSKNLSQFTYWLMNGATQISWKGFSIPSGYRPVAFGDFNGDGYTDILWDTPNNAVYMWLNNGNGGFISNFLVVHNPTSYIVGTADVNGDGNSDIIWRVPSSHQFTYWLMNGSTELSWRGFTIPDNYKFAGKGDFNGDGYADILWADSSRHVYMWLNNGSGTFTSQLINTYSTGWTLAGVGDVNGDGNSDIFWYNQTSGQFTYWLMNGYKMTSWSLFTLSNLNTPIGFGDYNGDGKADVLWNQPSNRGLWMWLDDGKGGFSRGHFIVHYSTNFVPMN